MLTKLPSRRDTKRFSVAPGSGGEPQIKTQGSRLGLGLGLLDDRDGVGGAVISTAIREKIEDVDVKAAVARIREGAFLVKYCRNVLRKPHQRLFWVDMEVLAIKWTSPKKAPQRTQIFLTDVDRIVPGEDSDFWRNKGDNEKHLGIELLSPTRKLRVVCANFTEWKVWLRGLLYAHQKAVTKRKRANSLTNDFIRKQWEMADLDQSGSIQFNELVHLLQRLNCRADVRYAEQLFDQYDEDGSRVLEYDEFKLLIHRLLTHQDVMDYFMDYWNKESMTVGEDGFRTFLHDVQRTPGPQVEECIQQMRQLEEPFRQDEGLTGLGFNFLMCSEFNSIIHPAKRTVYQDMTQPLSQYWIATSHNTYLTGDQVVGKSAVGQYIDVLLQGCRCVELDCWDGPDGEPVIYHGHTLTSKIPFGAVIKACKDYGFQASPYPILLSLEMHCTTKQKARIGQILTESLGDRIYRHESGEKAPSPKQLQGFFIVKGRKPNEFGEELEEGNEDDLMLEEEEMRLEILTGFPDQFVAEYPIGENPQPKRETTGNGNGAREGAAAAPKKKANPELDIYYGTVSLCGRRLKAFDDEKREAMDICSLNEKKLTKLARTRSRELAEFHQHYLSRVYPAGTRLMSSNYNPMPFWLLGAQLVALNYQALGLATLMNFGRFADNGGCGYVLKPEIMRMQNRPFDPNNPEQWLQHSSEAPVKLTIQVLAAQQLPRPSTDNKRQANKRKDVACPYVVVSLQGLKGDTQTHRTPHMPNNGLNPRWKDQIFTFEVTVPSLSLLVFEVRNYDSVRSDFLAGAAVPLSCIRTGIRWVGLCDSRLKEIQWSGLLVLISIKRAAAPPQPTALSPGLMGGSRIPSNADRAARVVAPASAAQVPASKPRTLDP